MRRVAIPLGLAVIALLWWLKRQDAPAPLGPAQNPTTAASTSSSSAAAALPEQKPSLPPPPPPPPEPGEPQEYPVDPERDEQVARIHRQVISFAAPCYRALPPRSVRPDPAAPDETMQELRLRLEVMIEAGRARLASVEEAEPNRPEDTLGSPLQDQDLADCIVDTLVMGELDVPPPVPPGPKPTEPPRDLMPDLPRRGPEEGSR
jgi:hypothetical protein